MLFPTTLVGSYSQPEWLIDRAKLAEKGPPRIRRTDLWRIPDEFLEQAQDDATLIAIRAQERAGLDIITDGEIRRESYSNRFATALEGVDIENPGIVPSRSGRPDQVPRIVGKIRRKHAVEARDTKFLRANTDKTIKITVPGPFTMAQQAKDEFYNDEVAVAMDYAIAVNEEVKDLFAAGADIVQLDEPYMQARPDKARDFGIKAVNRALQGVTGKTAIHLCFGYAYIVKNKPNEYAFLTELEDQIEVLDPAETRPRTSSSASSTCRRWRSRRRRSSPTVSCARSRMSIRSGSWWRRIADSSSYRTRSPMPRCVRWSKARRSRDRRSAGNYRVPRFRADTRG